MAERQTVMTAQSVAVADDGWTFRFNVTADNRRVIEALTTTSNGRFGTRGLLDHDGDLIPGSTVGAGLYDSDDVPSLLQGPRWSAVDVDGRHEWDEVAILNLATGVLRVELTSSNRESADDHGTPSVVATLATSIADPDLHLLRVEGPAEIVEVNPPLLSPSPKPGIRLSHLTGLADVDGLVVSSERSALRALARQVVDESPGRRTITRFVRLEGCPHASPQRFSTVSTAPVMAAQRAGFDILLGSHEERWRERWAACAVDMADRPELESAFRFAQYHLLSASTDDPEVAVGARGLTGPAYRGHVFWDTDVYVVPALSAMAPPLALAALRYRVNRLQEARKRAAERGLAGALFPWESASTGADVTPVEGRDLHGAVIPILTGSQEEHIVADVAWAVMNHAAWTGDERFLITEGAEIVMETARYWQSRVEVDSDGSGHIRGVIGPDEYHETVDDSVFTNEMARWNLRTAARVAGELGTAADDERNRWLETAEVLAGGYDDGLGIHEQFAGFFDLEPVMAAAVGEPPLPADALVGHDRIQQTQIIKQADVLMLHHLIPDDRPPGSRDRDLDYYLPRTAHGSSLSPAITAAQLARAGRSNEAMRWFELSARFDLDDVSDTTAGGVHLATMGGLWQALAIGFFGLKPSGEVLLADPLIPEQLGAVTLRLNWRSVPIRLEGSAEHLAIHSPAEIAIRLPGVGMMRGCDISVSRFDGGWEPV